jgi:hypothetical protein
VKFDVAHYWKNVGRVYKGRRMDRVEKCDLYFAGSVVRVIELKVR